MAKKPSRRASRDRILILCAVLFATGALCLRSVAASLAIEIEGERLQVVQAAPAPATFLPPLEPPPEDNEAEPPRQLLPAPCVERNIRDTEQCKQLIESFRVDQPAELTRPPVEAVRIEPPEVRPAPPVQGTNVSAIISDLPKECAERGIMTKEECLRVRTMSAECRDKGVTDEEECRRLISQPLLPSACRERGITDPYVCKTALLEKNGKPKGCQGIGNDECLRLIDAGKIGDREAMAGVNKEELPPKCKELGATDFDSCEKMARERLVPEECRAAGIVTAEACKKYMFEKFQASGTMPFLPTECEEAGLTGAAACRTFMQSKNFPNACLEKGITSAEACTTFLAATSLPEECRKSGIEESEGCEAMLREKHLFPACRQQGIADAADCEQFIYDRMAGSVKCEGLDAEQCMLALKGRHLGKAMEAGSTRERIDDVLGRAAGEDGMIDIGSLQIRADDTHARFAEIAPMKMGRAAKLRVLESEAGVMMNDKDELRAASGKMLAHDDDGDGVPNDVERRHGTDSSKADTDGDGISDREELKTLARAGIDRALLEGRPLGQPTIEGLVDEKLTAELGASGEGLGLEGAGVAGEVVTLYIYSDLPIVVTTTVDENGEWSYVFEDDLKDGGHEVYVAINDDTGKVIRKSNPLSFMIGTAQAAEEDVVASETPPRQLDPSANAVQGTYVAKDIGKYLIAGAALVAAAILGLLLMLGRMSKKTPTQE